MNSIFDIVSDVEIATRVTEQSGTRRGGWRETRTPFALRSKCSKARLGKWCEPLHRVIAWQGCRRAERIALAWFTGRARRGRAVPSRRHCGRRRDLALVMMRGLNRPSDLATEGAKRRRGAAGRGRSRSDRPPPRGCTNARERLSRALTGRASDQERGAVSSACLLIFCGICRLFCGAPPAGTPPGS